MGAGQSNIFGAIEEKGGEGFSRILTVKNWMKSVALGARRQRFSRRGSGGKEIW